MSALGFYALGSAWLFALAAPLVLFYFLKLKRPRVQVPSLVLWRRVIEDRRVNSPFQRFKRNLLLLLQMALLMLLCLAALQPFWRAGQSQAERMPVLVDSSASMAALDAPGGKSRLEAAKEQVGALIDGLKPAQQMCIISFDSMARKRADFTDNKRLLRDALDAIQVADVPSGLEEALRMAEAMARTGPFDEVLLFSDGNLPGRVQFDLPFKLDYRRLPPAGPNVGITSLNATRAAAGGWDVFVGVEGSEGADGPVTLNILYDGRQAASRNLSLGASRRERIGFSVPGERAVDVQVDLVPEGADSLASDNTAYLHLESARRLQVYAPASLGSYRHALEALDSVTLAPAEGAARDIAYDLVVTDQPEDRVIETRTALYVGMVPDDLKDLVSVTKAGSAAVDWDRAAPLFQYVEFGDVAILDQPVSAEGVGEGDYENRGYQVLLHGQKGPLILEKQSGQWLQFDTLFHTDRSTLPYRVGFPVLVSNLVRVAMQQAGLAQAQGAHTGVLGGIRMRPNEACTVTSPSSERREETAGTDGILPGVPAPEAGLYTLSGGGQQRRVGASLLSSSETRLAAVEQIEFAEDLSVKAAAGVLKADRPLWPLLAMLGFIVLLGEWWYYQRGAGGRAL
jgi:Ca-activated chloride channel family protein